MKRITLLYDFLSELGGLERMMFLHANKLYQKYVVELLFSYVNRKEEAKIRAELELDKKIPIRQVGSSSSELLELALTFLKPSRYLKTKSDLFVSYSFMGSWAAYVKNKHHKTPYIVIICHPPNFLYTEVEGWANNVPRFLAHMLGLAFGSLLKKIDRRNIQGAQEVVAISEYTARKVQKLYGVKPKILYPPVSSFFYPLPQVQQRAFLKEKKITRPYLYAHGRIIPDKNCQFLLEILPALKDCDLIISGTISPHYRAQLEEEIKSRNLSARVRLLGRISKEDLRLYYNCASLFLVPAKKEDFGLTVVEAPACGCPVVAWDDDAGPSEIVTPSSGLLAQPYKKEEFIAQVRKGLRMKWDAAKVRASVKKFSAQAIQQQLQHIVAGALSSKKK